MIRNSLFITATLLLLAFFGLMSRLDFLASYKNLLFLHCGASLAVYFGTLALNLFAATLAINRKFLLKDTGRKLSHFDKQLQSGTTERIPPLIEELD